MLDTVIRRTYNRHGDCDYLTRMDNTPRGWCPVWSDARVCGGQTFRETARNIYSAFDESAAREIYAGA